RTSGSTFHSDGIVGQLRTTIPLTFFFSSRRRHTSWPRDWSSDVCSSDLVPFVLNQENPNQLFLGTFRLYRTDNARTSNAGDVRWKPISGDLTSGCTGPAPNGARACVISAIGIGGGQAVYTGSEDGLIYVS